MPSEAPPDIRAAASFSSDPNHGGFPIAASALSLCLDGGGVAIAASCQELGNGLPDWAVVGLGGGVGVVGVGDAEGDVAAVGRAVASAIAGVVEGGAHVAAVGNTIAVRVAGVVWARARVAAVGPGSSQPPNRLGVRHAGAGS